VVLLVALALLLVAAGLLVTSFSTADTVWAWASIGVSGAAAVVLLARWWRARRRRAARSRRHRGAGRIAEPTDTGDGLAAADAGPEPRGADEEPLPDGAEPAEEDTDAADMLVVCELEDEVLVVDEHPRYHLAGCRWLVSRSTEPLPAREARELGFTPCGRCGPDAALATRHRTARSGS